jgi:hypothetical protein
LERTSALVHPENAAAHCALQAPTELPGKIGISADMPFLGGEGDQHVASGIGRCQPVGGAFAILQFDPGGPCLFATTCHVPRVISVIDRCDFAVAATADTTAWCQSKRRSAFEMNVRGLR